MPEGSSTYKADGSHLALGDIYWENIENRDQTALVNMTFFEPLPENRLQFQFLNEIKCIDLSNRCLWEYIDRRWVIVDDPLLSLATLVYLSNIDKVYPMGKDIVGPNDLKEGHFFVGPHELRVQTILEKFGHDIKGFEQRAVALGGEPLEMADAAFRLRPFPRVPLYYLLWQGDEEFEPRVTILFDRSIEKTFPADAIWGLVNRVTMALSKV